MVIASSLVRRSPRAAASSRAWLMYSKTSGGSRKVAGCFSMRWTLYGPRFLPVRGDVSHPNQGGFDVVITSVVRALF